MGKVPSTRIMSLGTFVMVIVFIGGLACEMDTVKGAGL